ncbi:hypothetical protein A3K29_04925 [Candidatus Collierbacteria bacterium RIFOXYB2_FULL_46_14]|nr:MAG: hypothetical protein A3K29_04925 [Candidatus Collierbacteria bacterium RIFOXYB2_FULL_46_14]OGD76481.1 MAG: hypothetical protein A3K43_04925 [Candidatus Collierbacteria bacterium RIFOXYA2_FULL_46_20]OGD77817.1 MAG: hypothetical protein A3K39_04925 [Candidatus Collierbacteria bacterium RIFOXYC2_FULL_43_15]OGD81107.1 MAG: hypothetical protein A2320_05420 [Pseudomonadales bacterium GWC2_63_15]OGD82539.1 MAG: hypothetical protein A3K36_04925 [Candidatus Collierbacteria bacterium RIFOXYD2_FUL
MAYGRSLGLVAVVGGSTRMAGHRMGARPFHTHNDQVGASSAAESPLSSLKRDLAAEKMHILKLKEQDSLVVSITEPFENRQ